MRVCCSMPGKRGDALWSLPTVREIAKTYGPVDFYIMDHFKDICPIIEKQPYINKAQGVESWQVDGNKAIQDVSPGLLPGYEKQFDLGYRSWPTGPLVDFIARQAGVDWGEHSPIPFLTVNELPEHDNRDVAFGYSIYYDSQKDEFINQFVNRIRQLKPDFTWIDTTFLPWEDAASWISKSRVFIGDCSAPHVVAAGMDKPVVLTESNGERRTHTFVCPYAEIYVYECTNILQVLEHYVNKTLELL